MIPSSPRKSLHLKRSTTHAEALQQLMKQSGDNSILKGAAPTPGEPATTLPLRKSLDHQSLGELKRVAGNQGQITKRMASNDPSTPPPIQDPSLGSLTHRHADILNFVVKQQTKSIATKELLRHLVFTTIFLTIFALQRSVFESYLMNQSLSTAFVTQQIDYDLQPFPKTFLDVGQNDELRDYLVSIVGGTLDDHELYTGLPLTPDQRNFVMSNNRLLGGVRFRQLRAAPNKGCRVPANLRDITNTCYAYGYSDVNKDTSPFGPASDPQKYKYQTGKECGSISPYTSTIFGLEGGGYVLDMPLGSNFTDLIQELIDDEWWDSATRAIIITMNFLSVDLDRRVAVMYLVIEMPGNGEAMPSVTFKTFRLNLYVSNEDWFRLALEVLFVFILMHMIVKEFLEMKACYGTKRGIRKYFDNGWNWNEIANIALFVTAIAVYANYLLTAVHHPDLAVSEYSPFMEQLASKAWTYYTINYFNCLLLCFQTFKYLRMNRRLYMLWKTLQHAGTDLVGFLFIFLIFVFGFVFTAWLTFGDEMEEFSSFNASFGTCWNFLIGNPPDYIKTVQANPIIGPIYFMFFTIFVFFILANMFIAIVGNSFGIVRARSIADQVGIKEAINTKLSNCFKSTKKLAKKATERSQRGSKRTIVQILDGLLYPEVLEKPGLTVDDIFRACGPEITEAEALELYEWIERLESKKKHTIKGIRRSSTIDEIDFTDDDITTVGTEMKPVQKPDYAELLASVDSLRDDLQRLMLLIPQVQPQSPPLSLSPPLSPQPVLQHHPAQLYAQPSQALPQSRQKRSQSARVPPVVVVIPDASPRRHVQDVQLSPRNHPSHARSRDNGPPPPSPPDQSSNVRPQNNPGPPPPSPQLHNIPPIPLSLLQQSNPPAQARDSSRIGPPPPTPSLRGSSQHIPPIPPPPQHAAPNHSPHGHSPHDAQTHNLLHVPSVSPMRHQRSASTSSAPSPANSPPPSPNVHPLVPLSDPPTLVLDPPNPEDSTTPRKRTDQ